MHNPKNKDFYRLVLNTIEKQPETAIARAVAANISGLTFNGVRRKLKEMSRAKLIEHISKGKPGRYKATHKLIAIVENKEEQAPKSAAMLRAEERRAMFFKPLESRPAPFVRAGADDYLQVPSRMGSKLVYLAGHRERL